MIKVFGKMRYHWQPDLSWSISYWSLVTLPFFFYLILIYEYAKIPTFLQLMMLACLVLVVLGFHRYFVIEPDGLLRITSANPFKNRRIPIKTIDKVEVTYSSITIFSSAFPEGKVFYMRKWPKKYFVNALTLNEHFQGEIELIDHLIKLDYFEVYYRDKAKRT